MIFLDTETTGLLNPDAVSLSLQPSIIQLYAVKLTDDLKFISEIDTLMNPKVAIPHHITKITGITDAHVANAPEFVQVYDQLTKFFLGESTVVAHNVAFDMGMLWCELSRLGLEFKFPWPPTHICTVEKSEPIENHRLKLGRLHEIATGEPHKDAHSAKGDVIAMVRCYAWMKEQGR